MTIQEKSIEQLERISSHLATIGEKEDYTSIAIQALEQTKWIPCNVRLPKQNEYIGNVCKYYLVQDEHEDMYVAHYTERGWNPIDTLFFLHDVVAWMPLPERYEYEGDNNDK